jgi:hypothetical protein
MAAIGVAPERRPSLVRALESLAKSGVVRQRVSTEQPPDGARHGI